MLNSASGARIGLVLGAGGNDGGAFIRGAVAALQDHAGWDPFTAATVIGTSIGALRGARLKPGEEDAGARPAGLDHGFVGSLAEGLEPLDGSAADRLVVPIRRVVGRSIALLAPDRGNPASYPVGAPPYHPGLSVVAVRRRWGARRITRLSDAEAPAQELYASAAIPAAAKPVTIDGREYLDGAVHSTTNADLIDPAAHDALIVIAPMVTRTGGSLSARSHRALLRAELNPWSSRSGDVAVVVPDERDLVDRADHDRYSEIAYAKVARALG